MTSIQVGVSISHSNACFLLHHHVVAGEGAFCRCDPVQHPLTVLSLVEVSRSHRVVMCQFLLIHLTPTNDSIVYGLVISYIEFEQSLRKLFLYGLSRKSTCSPFSELQKLVMEGKQINNLRSFTYLFFSASRNITRVSS